MKTAAVACLGLVMVGSMRAQDTAMPSTLNSASDLARQAQGRQQGSVPQAQSSAQQLADRLESEQELQQEAPVGYKSVRDEGLPYSVLMPQFAELQSRAYDGAHYVALGEGPSVTIVLGGPVTAEGETPDIQIARANQQYLGCGAASVVEINGAKVAIVPINSISPHCGRGYDLLGQAALFAYEGNIYPVVCGYTMTVADHTPNTERTPWKKIQKKWDNQQLGMDACERVIHSVVFPKAQDFVQPREGRQRTVIPPSLLQQKEETAAMPADDLAAAARRAKKDRTEHPAHVFDGSNFSGPEYVEFRLPYCVHDGYQCYVASFQVPSKAIESVEGAFRQFSVPIGEVPGTLDYHFGKKYDQPEWMSDEEYAQGLSLNSSSTYEVYNPNGPKVTALAYERTHIGRFVAAISRSRSDTDYGSTTEVRAYIGTPGYVMTMHCESRTEDFEKMEAACSKFINSLRVQE